MANPILPHANRSHVIPFTIQCRCGQASIPAPLGSTPQTSFTCRECCAVAMRKRKAEKVNGVYYIGGPMLDSGIRELAGL